MRRTRGPGPRGSGSRGPLAPRLPGGGSPPAGAGGAGAGDPDRRRAPALPALGLRGPGRIVRRAVGGPQLRPRGRRDLPGVGELRAGGGAGLGGVRRGGGSLLRCPGLRDPGAHHGPSPPGPGAPGHPLCPGAPSPHHLQRGRGAVVPLHRLPDRRHHPRLRCPVRAGGPPLPCALPDAGGGSSRGAVDRELRAPELALPGAERTHRRPLLRRGGVRPRRAPLPLPLGGTLHHPPHRTQRLPPHPGGGGAPPRGADHPAGVPRPGGGPGPGGGRDRELYGTRQSGALRGPGAPPHPGTAGHPPSPARGGLHHPGGGILHVPPERRDRPGRIPGARGVGDRHKPRGGGADPGGKPGGLPGNGLSGIPSPDLGAGDALPGPAPPPEAP